MGDFGQVGAAGISAAANAAISAATNATNYRMNERTNTANKEIAAQNNATQIQMNDTNNQFSHDEAELAYQREVEQWNRETQYNSPIEQVQRLQSAGLNPNVYLSQNGLTNAVGASAQPMASPHGSGITPSMPNLIPFQMSAPSLGTDFAEIFKALSEGKKTGVEAEQISAAMQDYLASLREDVRGKQIANDIQASFGRSTADARLSQIVQETATARQLAEKYASEGNLNDANKVLAEAKTKTEKELRKLTKTQRQIFEKERDTFDARTRAVINELNTRSKANVANASESYAHADLFKEEKNNLQSLLPSQLYLNRAQERFYREQVKYLGSEILTNESLRNKIADECLQIIEQTRGTRLANDIREATKKDIVKMIEYQAKQSRQDYHNPFHYVGSALGGSAGAAISLGRD